MAFAHSQIASRSVNAKLIRDARKISAPASRLCVTGPFPNSISRRAISDNCGGRDCCWLATSSSCIATPMALMVSNNGPCSSPGVAGAATADGPPSPVAATLCEADLSEGAANGPDLNGATDGNGQEIHPGSDMTLRRRNERKSRAAPAFCSNWRESAAMFCARPAKRWAAMSLSRTSNQALSADLIDNVRSQSVRMSIAES